MFLEINIPDVRLILFDQVTYTMFKIYPHLMWINLLKMLKLVCSCIDDFPLQRTETPKY